MKKAAQTPLTKTFSKQFMIDNRGCYTLEQLEDCSFMKVEDFVTLESILESEIDLKDKFWFVCRKAANKSQNQKISVAVAEIVLPIFEEQYPDDKRPAQCIEATKKFLTGDISLEQLNNAVADAANHADAAYAAYSAANAAYAADVADAAYAAYAAANAAYAADAADAAYAAYSAANAAEAAAYAAISASTSYANKLLQFLISFCQKN
jgi:hypothetical protein